MPFTPDSTVIREATRHDGQALAALQRSLGLFAIVRGESAAATEERVARQLERCLEDASHSVYIAVDPSDRPRVLGYVAVHWLPYLIHEGSEGFVSELFIDERARGKRLGTRLLEAVEAEARARGCPRLQLINLRNRPSYQRRFYEKAGWVEGPERASFLKQVGD